MKGKRGFRFDYQQMRDLLIDAERCSPYEKKCWDKGDDGKKGEPSSRESSQERRDSRWPKDNRDSWKKKGPAGSVSTLHGITPIEED